MTEVDFKKYQRQIFQCFRKISNQRSNDEQKAYSVLENNKNDSNDLLNEIILNAENQIKEQTEKMDELSHLLNTDKLLLIAIFVYLLFIIPIPWQYTIIVSQIISYVALSRVNSIWDMDKALPRNKDRWCNMLLLIIPLLPLGVALYYRFYRYPEGLKVINERYPNALEDEEADRLLQETEQVYENLMESYEISYQNNMDELRSTYENSLGDIREVIDDLKVAYGIIGASWDDELWQEWIPENGEHLAVDNIAPFIRIGTIVKEGIWNDLSMPCLLPVINGGNVLIKVSDEGKELAIGAIRSMMLRLLAFVPPNKLHFTLIDPVSSGRDLSDFLSLNDYNEALTGGSIWTEPRDIETQLDSLNKRMEFITQDILRKYTTIEDYNTNAGVMGEPYRILVTINYPVNFTDISVRYLKSIARNGPRCGIFTIITADTEKLQTE